ncbi:YceI family protein [soil metagenome]
METAEVSTKNKWAIDPTHSDIAFKVKHLAISNVKGVFTNFKATIYTKGDSFITSEIDFRMDATSIDTGDKKRDDHLKGPDFFDVKKHTQITFTGDTYERSDITNHYELYGHLTIKGITKQIKLNVEFLGAVKDSSGNEKAGFSLHSKINRTDWGLKWNSAIETGGLLVSEEVMISCEVQLVKQ